MVKRALTLLTSILFALTLLVPFNIYADTITNSNVLGINTILLSKSQNVAVTNSWYYVYQHTITLDADYIGTITLDVNLTYYNPSGSSSSYGTSTISNKTYFVNGNTITINQVVTSDNFGNQGPIVSSSYLLKSSNVLKTSTITELQQIIDLLTDIYNSEDQVEGLLNNQLEQLQLVVSNTSLANTYLDTISKTREWNIDFESLPLVLFMLNHYNPTEFGVSDISYLNNYPIFDIPSGERIYSTYGSTNGNYYFIFIASGNIASLNALKSTIGFTRDDIEFTNFSYLARGRWWSNSNNYYLVKATFHTTTNNYFGIDNIGSSNLRFIPIYLGNVNAKRISTDFALKYDLSNNLLDNIEKIANGTVQSNSAASSNDLANEQLQTDSNTLFTQEENFKSDMNNAMQNVNNTFRLSDMGTKFVTSAQWVRTQYENITNNTPFASLITFSLITGLALILLGKVYK